MPASAGGLRKAFAEREFPPRGSDCRPPSPLHRTCSKEVDMVAPDLGPRPQNDVRACAARTVDQHPGPCLAVLVALGAFSALMSSPVQAQCSGSPTGTWTETDTINGSRFAHTSTLLPSGKVLVAGGDDSEDGEKREEQDGNIRA